MLKQFFIICSGSDTKILESCSEGEQNKYVGIGATVFFTALMVMFNTASVGSSSNVDGVSFYCVGKCQNPRRVISKGGNALLGGHMYPGVTKLTDLDAYRF